MRVLIVNSNLERSPWPVPPIGACAVAAAADREGHEVRLLDLCFEAQPERAVTGTISSFRPDVVGVSIRNIDNVDWQAPRFYLEEVKRRVIGPCKAAGCPIVLGGPAVGIMPAQCMDYLGVDFAVRGDGEVAFPQLLRALQNGGDLAAVEGLAYREGDTVQVAEPARAEDLDTLHAPHPHRWVDLSRYLVYNGSLGIQTKRGCALRCTYCTYNQIEGRCYRTKSVERIAAEIEEAVTEARVHAIEFVDSTFNLPLDHALDVLSMLARRKFPCRFNTMGINPGGICEELFRLLRDAGFSEVSITPESASPSMLESLGKRFAVEDVLRAAHLARKVDLPVLWYFMFGAPGENESTVEETLRFVERHIPDDHLVQFVTGIRIFEGAPIEAIARRQGQLAGGDSLLWPVWYQPDIDREKLFSMLGEAVSRHPNYILLQDNDFPKPVLRAAMAFHRFFRCRRPIWQHLRHVRRLAGAFGLGPAGRRRSVRG